MVGRSLKGIGKKGKAKISRTFKEFGKGKLHSGSKTGPVVKSHRQAIAIALSQGRKASRAGRRR